MQTVLKSCVHERSEQRMRRQRFRFEFGMKLAREEPRMIIAREFDNFDKLLIGRNAAEHQTALLQLFAKGRIEFVSMTVTLADLRGAAVNFAGERILGQLARPGAQAHCSTQLLDVNQVT